MKEEGFNPNAVITDQVIDALANIQDYLLCGCNFSISPA